MIDAGRWLFSAGLLITVAGCDHAAEQQAVRFEHIGPLAGAGITEASGLQIGPGGRCLYVINDSGNAPELFRVDLPSLSITTMSLDNARNRDWEDLALIPGADESTLVIADIGDNQAQFSTTRLWAVSVDCGETEGDELPVHRHDIAYPGGPRDAESLAWDPLTERLILVSKRDQPPRIYSLAWPPTESEWHLDGALENIPAPSSSELLRSPHQGRWAAQPNGMDISPDGQRAAIVTYRGVYVWMREDDTPWAKTMSATPWFLPFGQMVRAESVAFTADGEGLWITLEGDDPPLLRAALPPLEAVASEMEPP